MQAAGRVQPYLASQLIQVMDGGDEWPLFGIALCQFGG